MAMPQNSDVHMETMEATEDKAEKSDETWYSGVLCSHGGKQQERLLVHICNKYGQQSIIKERLIRAGFYDLTSAYQSVHVNY